MTWLVTAVVADGSMDVANEDGSQSTEITSVDVRMSHVTGAVARTVVPTECAPRCGERLDAAAFDALINGSAFAEAIEVSEPIALVECRHCAHKHEITATGVECPECNCQRVRVAICECGHAHEIAGVDEAEGDAIWRACSLCDCESMVLAV